MEMNIDSTLLIKERKDRAWSQQQLADVFGVSLRTIQRIEKTGIASGDSIQAISSAIEKPPYSLLLTESEAKRKSIAILSFVAGFLPLVVGGFYLSQVTAEPIELEIGYRSETPDMRSINEGKYSY